MRAMILAAGLGTRLRPLTWIRPKVLVPVMGMPLLYYWVWRLCESGFEAVVVNAFHLSDRLVKAVQEVDWPIPVEVRVESRLLGTGGGIRNVLDFFDDEPFVVVNGDILCNVDFTSLYAQHLESNSSVSLLLHDFPAFNNVAVDDRFILGFGDKARKLDRERSDVKLLAFTGIHVLTPQVLTGLEPGHPHEIIPVYRDLIHSGDPPSILFERSLRWREIGSVEAYRLLHSELVELPENAFPPLTSGQSICVHPTAEISPDADLRGMVVIGRNARIMDRAVLENVILWDDVEVRPKCRLRNCIVTDGVTVRGSQENEILFENR